MKQAEQLPILAFESQQDWQTWLDAHQSDTQGLWLKLAKKESGIPSLSYAEALENALCYGWIDGQKAAFDGAYWLQKFTPRRARSVWSKVNCAKAEELIALGRMQPAGLRQVELARVDGRWAAAYESQSKIGIPADFQAALDANPPALEFFGTLNSANRYAVLYRIQAAKRLQTRSARIEQLIAMLAHHQKIHP